MTFRNAALLRFTILATAACSHQPPIDEAAVARIAGLATQYRAQIAARQQGATACRDTITHALQVATASGARPLPPPHAATLVAAVPFVLAHDTGLLSPIGTPGGPSLVFAALPFMAPGQNLCADPDKDELAHAANLATPSPPTAFDDLAAEEANLRRDLAGMASPTTTAPALVAVLDLSCAAHKRDVYGNGAGTTSTFGQLCKADLVWLRVADAALVAAVHAEGYGHPGDLGTSATADQLTSANNAALEAAYADLHDQLAKALAKWPN
jgi:hypothetical protein